MCLNLWNILLSSNILFFLHSICLVRHWVDQMGFHRDNFIFSNFRQFNYTHKVQKWLFTHYLTYIFSNKWKSWLFSDSAKLNLKDPQRVEHLEAKIASCLKDHADYNAEAQKKKNYFCHIMQCLADLKNVSKHGLQRLLYLKLEDDVIPAPPLIEKMFLSTLPYP